VPRGLRHLPPRIRRHGAFIVASFAENIATQVSVPPSGVASAPYSGPTQPGALYARLEPDSSLKSADERRVPDGAAQPEPEPPVIEAKAEPRAGVPGGADIPFPDKWYTATEVDVRAEPIGQVRLDYPMDLEGTGIPGRVRLLLFIDERGVVTRMQITEAEPARLFDAAAMRAWTDVKFRPAQKDGVAVKSQKLLELNFEP
jgi:protein TonB